MSTIETKCITSTESKDYIPLPEELTSVLRQKGLEVERSYLKYYQYNRPIYFADKVVYDDNEFYIFYINEKYERKSNSLHPRHNLFYIEKIAFENNHNIIVINYKDIEAYGADLISLCILEKIRQLSHSDYESDFVDNIEYEIKDNIIYMYSIDTLVGIVEYDLSNTVLRFDKWVSAVDPYYWIDDIHEKITDKNTTNRIHFHPYDISPCLKILNNTSGLKTNRKHIDNGNGTKIYRSYGIVLDKKKVITDKISSETFQWKPIIKGVSRTQKTPENKKIKNNEKLRDKLAPGQKEILEMNINSHGYARFKCTSGHIYWNVIKEQLDYQCPVCSGYVVIPGINDLNTTHPDHAAMWDYNKNFPYTPEDVTQGSMRKFWWICPNTGLGWERPVNTKVRTLKSPFETDSVIVEGYNDYGSKFPTLIRLYSSKNPIPLSQLRFNNMKDTYIWECNKCNTQWERTLSTMTRSPYCTMCEYESSHVISKSEYEIFSYIRDILGEDETIIRNDRSVLKNLELDIYIPSENIAIEYNGLYWHSEFSKGKNYHSNKWKRCQDEGIRLITIWEDQWLFKREIVEMLLKRELTENEMIKDNISIYKIDEKQERAFFNTYHLEGYEKSDVCYGIFIRNDLISAVSLSIEKDTLHILRFSTIASLGDTYKRLLDAIVSYAQDNMCNSIIVEYDRTFMSRELLCRLGFTHLREVMPKKMFFINKKRYDEETGRKGEEAIYDCGSDLYMFDIKGKLDNSGYLLYNFSL